MTDLPPEITRDLDAHRTALALIRAILLDNPADAVDLWHTRNDDDHELIAAALAKQAAAYLTARYGGGDTGEKAAIYFTDQTLLAMASAA